MRRLFSSLILSVLYLTASAQLPSEGILKFMGIPVDGPKEQMIEKIKTKGFRSGPYNEYLTGQFNGRDVKVFVVDNHGVTYRVFVLFPETDEYRIRLEYNHLLSQFQRNEKYIPIEDVVEISNDEKILYEITLHNKEYKAGFYYISPDLFSKEQTASIHEIYNKSKANISGEEKELEQLVSDAFSAESEQTQTLEGAMQMLTRIASILAGNVWFQIVQNGGEYSIGLYYDNNMNAPKGEDL